MEAVGRETPGSQEFFRRIEVLTPSTPVVVCNLTRPGLDIVGVEIRKAREEIRSAAGLERRTVFAYSVLSTPSHSANAKRFVLNSHLIGVFVWEIIPVK